MSLEYCEDCDLMIDLDVDEHYEHFKDKYKEVRENYVKVNVNGEWKEVTRIQINKNGIWEYLTSSELKEVLK